VLYRQFSIRTLKSFRRIFLSYTLNKLCIDMIANVGVLSRILFHTLRKLLTNFY
jgi:hypothetical protein